MDCIPPFIFPLYLTLTDISTQFEDFIKSSVKGELFGDLRELVLRVMTVVRELVLRVVTVVRELVLRVVTVVRELVFPASRGRCPL